MSAWRDNCDGAAYAVRHRSVGGIILIGAVSVLCGAMINVAEPLLAIGPLHAGTSGFSVLVTVYGAGMVGGSAYAARLGSRISSLRARFLAGVALNGLALVACVGAGSLGPALVPFGVAGFANALIVGPQIRLVQELVVDRFRGRVFGLRDSVECACFALAFLAAGGLLNVVGVRALYALAGISLVATALLGAAVFRRPESAGAAFPGDVVALADTS